MFKGNLGVKAARGDSKAVYIPTLSDHSSNNLEGEHSIGRLLVQSRSNGSRLRSKSDATGADPTLVQTKTPFDDELEDGVADGVKDENDGISDAELAPPTGDNEYQILQEIHKCELLAC
ncbi:hypothetical protein BDR22DRAFT_821451 [Usnea florida]